MEWLSAWVVTSGSTKIGFRNGSLPEDKSLDTNEGNPVDELAQQRKTTGLEPATSKMDFNGDSIKVEISLDALADKIAERISGQRPVNKRLLTRQEAAVYLGRSVRGLDGLVAKGAVASVRGDSRPMFDVRDLDAWIENNKE